MNSESWIQHQYSSVLRMGSKELQKTIIQRQESSTPDVDRAYERCKLIHRQILKIVYSKSNTFILFNQLSKILKKEASVRTLRAKIYDLRDWNLIKTTNKSVLCIYPHDLNEARVCELLQRDWENAGGLY